jgi:serine/threonine protein phosphatase PrpC
MRRSKDQESWDIGTVVKARTPRPCAFCGAEIRAGASRVQWRREFAHYACAPGLGSPVYHRWAWENPTVGRSSRLGGRSENEDRWRVWGFRGEAIRLAVADGMGGHAQGGEAASAAVSVLDQSAPLVEVVREAHRRACAASRGGTTLTIAEVRRTASIEGAGEGREVVFAQVGDSTALVVQPSLMPNNGVRLTPLLQTTPQGYGNRLYQCLGRANGDGFPDPVVTRAKVPAGAYCFVYSDGVNPAMEMDRLQSALAERPDSVQALADALTLRASGFGSTDNATILVFRVP